MTALFNALDNYTPSQIGENGHSEFTWSNSTREQILQLSFQLTRCKDPNQIENLSRVVDQILSQLATDYKIHKIFKAEFVGYMSIMFRLLGQTRDIIDGKGEYTLAYMQLAVWWKHYPDLAGFAFECFVVGPSHPFGSWKDVKGMIKYMEQKKTGDQLIAYAIKLLNSQLKEDITAEVPSLAAKWAPREKSSHANLFSKLAFDFYSDYLISAKSQEMLRRAETKAKMDYRKLISALNRKLDTVQIKQCANTWSEIDPAKQTSITMHKQKKAFLNKTKNGEQRSNSQDRIVCAANFEEFASKAEKGEIEIKGKRIGLNNFTKDALELISFKQHLSSEAQILNAQWVNNSQQTGKLGKMIAMVDVSGSMNGDPLHAAIALGIRIAEKSLLGKRVLTFSASPQWVNLDGCDNFIQSVEKVQRADWGMNTNFAAALNMILDAIVQNKLQPEDVEDMVLTILSDMQIDQADHNYGSMMDMIEKKYADTGMRLYKKPFKAPHILFWNLRSTRGFPALSTQKNASMMSGFSAALLNLFCEEGLDALQSCTPWSMFIKSLESERYQILDQRLREELSNI
jgi:Mg-chelatase subunit ChlD